MTGVVHYDLCFGCGRANLFGLQLEGEAEGEAGFAGRFFVKQDHQGPPGYAHGGIVAAALDEAMALALHAAGVHARTVRLEVELRGPAPVGGFLALAARVEERDEHAVTLRAEAREGGSDGPPVAEAVGVFRTVESDPGSR